MTQFGRHNCYTEAEARELAERVADLYQLSPEARKMAVVAAIGSPTSAARCYRAILASCKPIVVPPGHPGAVFH